MQVGDDTVQTVMESIEMIKHARKQHLAVMVSAILGCSGVRVASCDRGTQPQGGCAATSPHRPLGHQDAGRQGL